MGETSIDFLLIQPNQLCTITKVVRLAELYYPDWQVRVDGKPEKLLRADHALRAVAVPAGRHKVAFHFASRAFTLGLWVSLASSFAALVLLGAGWWLSARAAAPPALEGEAV